MEIIGSGFLARGLQPVAASHPGAVALAAGVSSTVGVAESAYQREAQLLYDVLARCRRQGRLLVFFSTASASMYAHPGSTGREDDPVFPGTPYGRHKLALETVVRLSGVPFLILRLSHVLGSGQPVHQLLPTLVRAVRSGTVEIHRGAFRDVIAVGDVAAAVDELLLAGVSGEVVNVASGISVPAEKIVDHIEARLGIPVERRFVERPAHYVVSLEKLFRFVGGSAVDAEYYKTVIDSCLEGPGDTSDPPASALLKPRLP